MSQQDAIHIVAKITPKPEFFEEGLQAIKAIIQPTRTEEGCYRFDVYTDKENTAYFIVEHFKNKKALEDHYNQQYTASVFQLYETILAKSPEITYLDPIKEMSSYAEGLSRYEAGLINLRKIDGHKGESIINNLSKVSPALARFIVEYPFSDVYSRDGLDLKSREIATVAMLVSMGDTSSQLRVHLAAAINVGVALNELEEIIIQSSVYAGFPRAINAMKIFSEFKAQAMCD